MIEKTAIEKARECIGQVANSPDDFLFTAKFLRENLKTLLAAIDAEKPSGCPTFDCYIASSDCAGCCLRSDCFPNEPQVQAYAASYHAEQCAKCCWTLCGEKPEPEKVEQGVLF